MLPLEEAIIMPIGDIQLDPVLRDRPRTCDIDRLQRHIAWGVDHGAYFIGMGDYVDVASPSNRDAIKRAAIYDNVRDALEEMAYKAQDEIQAILEPTRGRWLGLLEGHHYWEFESGQTTDTKLAEFLGCPHLGTTTLVEVKFEPNGHKRAPRFQIWAHHGRNGGKLLATPLNQLESVLKSFDADVYLVGHHHKQVAGKYQRLRAEFGRDGRGRLESKNVILASTGSFLKGYMQGTRRGNIPRGGYVEQGMMNPVALGGVVIYARPKYKDGYAEIDLDITL